MIKHPHTARPSMGNQQVFQLTVIDCRKRRIILKIGNCADMRGQYEPLPVERQIAPAGIADIDLMPDILTVMRGGTAARLRRHIDSAAIIRSGQILKGRPDTRD